ncbi:hypothetical protein GCM10027275_45700 [Rhabdobacter roseus]|uniref:Uncharacterized protein n=1 Tax=Rhabdobacter roseus TaxID=1655419 RepID=A0A840TYS3_9BACT|nr:hypothetical protein [Rhabdobacter roseus]MBB5286762.1 hypothetical protein [Rhabdobacter roseus]
MKKSNIFAVTELGKLVAGLREHENDFRKGLLSQAAYFLIIDPRYFSEPLGMKWVDLQARMTQRGPLVAADGTVILNKVVHTIKYLSEVQCLEIVERLISLHNTLQEECENRVLSL